MKVILRNKGEEVIDCTSHEHWFDSEGEHCSIQEQVSKVEKKESQYRQAIQWLIQEMEGDGWKESDGMRAGREALKKTEDRRITKVGKCVEGYEDLLKKCKEKFELISIDNHPDVSRDCDEMSALIRDALKD